MNYAWSKTVFPIAAIFSIRMLGLFLLIPVFTLYAKHLVGANPTLVGFALGAYGLSQGLLQIPFGLLSDKVGRKPIITLGLLLFACGSLLGAMAESIQGLIVARILQGGGAIGSVLIALLADLTPDADRTKAMAVIGMSIGSSFALAMVISPLVSKPFGLAGIFYLSLFLALVALVLLYCLIPKPPMERLHSDSSTKRSLFLSVLKNPALQGLNLGIFCQHFVLTATFFAIPLVLKQQQMNNPSYFYLGLMLLSFALMIPFIILAERKKRMKSVFLIAILFTGFAQTLLIFGVTHWLILCAALFVYFVAFNILEALLPSLVSRQANPSSKGTAMGIYSTGQFLGIFAGGLFAGFIYPWLGYSGIFMANAALAIGWFILVLFTQANTYLISLILPYTLSQKKEEEVIAAFLKLPGIQEVLVASKEEVLYLKLNKESYKPGSAEALLSQLK